MSTNRVVLLTDGRTSKAKAQAVQSVCEVTGVDAPEAVRLLGLNSWRATEAITECVNLREFRERLRQQAESHDGHRLCILSVHLIKLENLKHTGMHSICLDLDGVREQTGWISGDHAKFVGVSFEFRQFRPESRLGIEVWHKRTFRENKLVGRCSWPISSVAEDSILRYKGWIRLNHKETTGGNLQAEVWLRFFDLPSPSSRITRPPQESIRQSPKSTSSSSTDRQRTVNSNLTTPSTGGSRKSRISAARVSFEDNGGGGAGGQSEEKSSRQTGEDGQNVDNGAKQESNLATVSKSVDLLDDFFGASTEALPAASSISSSSSSAVAGFGAVPSWDLGALDPQLFFKREEENRRESQERGGVGSSTSSRSLSQERVTPQEAKFDSEEEKSSTYRTPEEESMADMSQPEQGASMIRRTSVEEKPIARVMIKEERSIEAVRGDPYLVSHPPMLYPSANEFRSIKEPIREVVGQQQQRKSVEWDNAWLDASSSSEPEAYYPAENLPPDPWSQSQQPYAITGRGSMEGLRGENFVRQPISSTISESSRRSSAEPSRRNSIEHSKPDDGQSRRSSIESGGSGRAPLFPSEDPPTSTSEGNHHHDDHGGFQLSQQQPHHGFNDERRRPSLSSNSSSSHQGGTEYVTHPPPSWNANNNNQ